MAQSALLTTGAPAPGTAIPDFALKLATKDGVTDFRLSEHLGKGPLVFAFFPLAFTGVCTKEVCDMRDNLNAFAGLNAQVYGFSTDPAPSNRAFAEREGLTYGILSDPGHQVIGRVWPTNPTPLVGVDGTAKRGAMVVNPDGTVKWAAASDDVKMWVGSDEVRKHLA
jgi:peroxiredoxin